MDVIQQAADYGAAIFIAVVFLVFMWQSWNKLSERYNTLMSSWNEQLNDDKKVLVDLVKGNQTALLTNAQAIENHSIVLASVRTALEALCGRMDVQERGMAILQQHEKDTAAAVERGLRKKDKAN